jgi:undecaprenyl-diphosphatase
MALFLLTVFTGLAVIVGYQDLLPIDTAIRTWLYNLRSDGLTSLMQFITFSANWQTITVVCLSTLLFKPFRLSIGLPLTISVLISSGLNELLKNLFLRDRPADILYLVSAHSPGFPSGHAMTGLVFYAMLLLLFLRHQKKRPADNMVVTGLVCMWIFLIGLSRIYLGVHYPSDVLAGWTFGLFLYVLFEYATDRFARKYIGNKG